MVALRCNLPPRPLARRGKHRRQWREPAKRPTPPWRTAHDEGVTASLQPPCRRLAMATAPRTTSDLVLPWPLSPERRSAAPAAPASRPPPRNADCHEDREPDCQADLRLLAARPGDGDPVDLVRHPGQGWRSEVAPPRRPWSVRRDGSSPRKIGDRSHERSPRVPSHRSSARRPRSPGPATVIAVRYLSHLVILSISINSMVDIDTSSARSSEEADRRA